MVNSEKLIIELVNEHGGGAQTSGFLCPLQCPFPETVTSPNVTVFSIIVLP